VRPELPYLAAGSLAILTGMARDRAWPKEGHKAIIATIVMVIMASTTAGTKVAPLVRAMGLLLVLGVTLSAVPVLKKSQVKR